MTNFPWLRLYTEITRDRKLRKLPVSYRWIWIAILCMARQSPRPGYLVLGSNMPAELADIADEAAAGVDDVTKAVQVFASDPYKMMDREGGILKVVNWDKRQFESDFASERMRRYRKRKTDRYVTVTSQETSPLRNRDAGVTSRVDNALRNRYVTVTLQKSSPDCNSSESLINLNHDEILEFPKTPSLRNGDVTVTVPDNRTTIHTRNNDYSAYKARNESIPSPVVVSAGRRSVEEEYAALIALVPEAKRTLDVTQKIKTALSKWSFDHTRRNIIYANQNATRNYPSFLGQALEKDWGACAQEKIERAEEAERKQRERQAQTDSETARETEEFQRAVEYFDCLPASEQQSLIDKAKGKNPIIRTLRPETVRMAAIGYLMDSAIQQLIPTQ
jgi:hypothetical protein